MEENPSLALVSQGPDLERQVDQRRMGAQVEAALGQVPERQRAALWLAAVDGHSYAEVAEILETSEKSVKALVHRARVSLAKVMQSPDRPPLARADGREGKD